MITLLFFWRVRQTERGKKCSDALSCAVKGKFLSYLQTRIQQKLRLFSFRRKQTFSANLDKNSSKVQKNKTILLVSTSYKLTKK